MKHRRPKQISDHLQLDEGEEQDFESYEPPSRRRSGRRKLINRLVPIAMIGFMVIMILKEEIPAFNDFLTANADPEGFAAIQACREAALENSTVEQYKRLIRRGESHPTADGHFVNKIMIGELGADGGEHRVAITCHIDDAGILVDINRKRLQAGQDTPSDFETGMDQTAF